MRIRSICLGLLAFLCGLSGLYMVLLYNMDPLFLKALYSKDLHDMNVRQDQMVKQLVELQQALREANVPYYLIRRLEDIIEFSKVDGRSNELVQPSCINNSDCSIVEQGKTQLLEVCPEKWSGRGNNLYYLDSWKTENCTNSLPLSSVLSILLFPMPNRTGVANCSDEVNSILIGLQKTYSNLPVLIASIDNLCHRKDELRHVQYVSVTADASNPGRVWNMLVAEAKTPYVLVARDLDSFMWFSDLNRPVRVLSSNKDIKIAGGAIRNRTGHWRVGCYQSSLRNYILEYREGYYTSKNDCMFCDHLLGPFVARTAFLKQNPFHESLPKEVVFEDFFLKLTPSNHTVVNCPDVMYFASDPTLDVRLNNKTVWLPLARRWELNRIVVPVNRVFAYTCEESGLTCKKIGSLVESFSMPICCIEQVTKAAVVMDKFCRQHKIPYELAGGSVMGLVKMIGVMPWDHDGDLFYFGNYTIFNESKIEFAKEGLRIGALTFVANEYRWTYFTPDIDFDMSGCAQMSYDSLEDKMFREFPTQAQLYGHWMYVMPNPGGYSRNNYGSETLKHAHHFRLLKQKFEDPYKGGHFNKCKNLSHHACLNRFSADGSLQFVVPN